jgi:hypothetical protein
VIDVHPQVHASLCVYCPLNENGDTIAVSDTSLASTFDLSESHSLEWLSLFGNCDEAIVAVKATTLGHSENLLAAVAAIKAKRAWEKGLLEKTITITLRPRLSPLSPIAGGYDVGDGEHAGEEAETGNASGPEVTAETSPSGGGDDGDGEHAGEEAETGDASGPEIAAETSPPASALQTSPRADSAATSQAKEHHHRRSARNTPGADSAATSQAKEHHPRRSTRNTPGADSAATSQVLE